ncbi:metallophosphoesterase [Siminovitchia sediminis]|uniref:Metallophosphoesterase n=1 Tax=Siminovitchia sediminis TaxID=1274353 RepID=A0ABW4KJ84_9BACI
MVSAGISIVILASVIGILSLFITMVRSAFANTVRTDSLSFKQYPEGLDELSIFFISDIHRRTVHENIIRQVKGEADIVVIGGDLAEQGVSFSKVRQNVKNLSEIAPVYFIWGNNDYEIDAGKLKGLFQECSVTALKNHSVYLKPFHDQIALIGVDYTDTSNHLKAILHSIKRPVFRIVLSHNPALAEQLSEEDQCHLMLSGHTHGGQIRIIGLSPYEKGGIKKYPGTTLFLSNGYGTSLVPLRLGAPAETHLIKVCRQNN